MAYALCNTAGIRALSVDTKLVVLRPALRYEGYRFGIANTGTNSKPSRFATSVFGECKAEFCECFEPESMKIFTKGAEKRMTQTTQKNIRFTSEQWKRVENQAKEQGVSPNRLVVKLTIEGLERREWPRTAPEIHLLRSAMFTAQAIIRDMEKAGREEEIEQISRNISEVAPELPRKSENDLKKRVDAQSDYPVVATSRQGTEPVT